MQKSQGVNKNNVLTWNDIWNFKHRLNKKQYLKNKREVDLKHDIIMTTRVVACWIYFKLKV